MAPSRLARSAGRLRRRVRGRAAGRQGRILRRPDRPDGDLRDLRKERCDARRRRAQRRGRSAGQADRAPRRGRPGRGLRGGVFRFEAHHAGPRRGPHRRERLVADSRRGADRAELQGAHDLALVDQRRGHEEGRLRLPRLLHRPLPGPGAGNLRPPGPEGEDRRHPRRRPERLFRGARGGVPRLLRGGGRPRRQRAQVRRGRRRLFRAVDRHPAAAAGRPARSGVLHGRGPDRAPGAVPRPDRDPARRRRLGLAQARRDRRRGDGGFLPVEPLLRRRSLARRSESSSRRTRRSTAASRTRSPPCPTTPHACWPTRSSAPGRPRAGASGTPWPRPRISRASRARSRWMRTGTRSSRP